MAVTGRFDLAWDFRPEMRRLLEGVIVATKLSSDWEDFQRKLDLLYPKFGDTLQLPFEQQKSLPLPRNDKAAN